MACLWRAALARRGTTPPFVDGQIAAIAHGNDLVLVTTSSKDCGHFREVKIADSRFKLARSSSPEEVTDGHRAEYLDMATRLAVCAQRLPRFAAEPGFKDLTAKAGRLAGMLRSAVKEGDDYR